MCERSSISPSSPTAKEQARKRVEVGTRERRSLRLDFQPIGQRPSRELSKSSCRPVYSVIAIFNGRWKIHFAIPQKKRNFAFYNREKIKYGKLHFSGHESFACKLLWLKQGNDLVVQERDLPILRRSFFVGISCHICANNRWRKIEEKQYNQL